MANMSFITPFRLRSDIELTQVDPLVHSVRALGVIRCHVQQSLVRTGKQQTTLFGIV